VRVGELVGATLDRWCAVPPRRYCLFLLAAGLAVTGAAALSLVTHKNPFIDLEVYRLGMQAWLGGGDIYGALPPTSAGIALPYIYPPFSALVLVPFTVTPWAVAVVATFVLSVVALAITLYVVARRLWPNGGRHGALTVSAVALPLAMVLEPVRETFSFGQINLWLMALVTVDCLARKPWWPRGLLVGLAAAIKIAPIAFVLFFVLRKDFPSVRNVAIGGGAATALGFVVAFQESVQYWFGGLAGASKISGSPYATNQTITAALARLNFPGSWQLGLRAVLTLAVLAAAIIIMVRANPPLALMVNAASALVVSPTSWSHHWVWIAPTLLMLTGYAIQTDKRRWTAAVAAAAAVFVTAPHQMLPRDANRELNWAVWQHLVGNTYLLMTLAALFAGAWSFGRRPT
jgi:alpha-1,2-mannosyltransferase